MGVVCPVHLSGLFPPGTRRASQMAIYRASAGVLPCEISSQSPLTPKQPRQKIRPRRAVRAHCCVRIPRLITLCVYFAPSHPMSAFGGHRLTGPPPVIVPVLSSTLLPGFAGQNFITTTGASATSHQQKPWVSPCAPASRDQGLRIRCQASPVTAPAPCKVSHPQSLYVADRVPGFALFCMLAPTHSRIRFVCAMYTLLPMASFRPHRWPVAPLPFGLSSPRSG